MFLTQQARHLHHTQVQVGSTKENQTKSSLRGSLNPLRVLRVLCGEGF